MPRVPVLVTYRPKKGKEARFLAILRRHWPALRKAGLAAAAAPRVWRGTDKRSGRVFFFESFAWANETASARAHEHPLVQAIWRPMMPLLDDMSIAVVEEVPLRAAGPRTRTRAGKGRLRGS